LLIYFLIFSIHFYLLQKSCAKDCGAALERFLNPQKFFLTQSVDAFTYGNNPPSGNLLDKFFTVNFFMLGSNFDDSAAYIYQSDWWNWPLMSRPVLYFKEPQDSKTSFIYFIGNPFVWGASIIGIIGYFYLIVKNFLFKFKLKIPKSFYSENFLLLIAGYLFYFLPFLSIKRYMLIYHYLPALIFSIIIFSVFFEGLLEMIFGPSNKNKILFPSKRANAVFIGLLMIILLSFFYFSPLTYGFPLTNEEFQDRMWLETWEI